MRREDAEWADAQRAHYDARPHVHLRAEAGGLFAENLIEKLWRSLRLGDDASGAEIGCGAGRFTLPLLAHCRRLTAIDLSPRQLERLQAELDAREIPPERCRLLEANVEQLGDEIPDESLDFVLGVFVLHHLQEPEAALSRLRRLLRPGGRAAFLEPNRWNPLYLVQIACCPDMSWAEEKALYRRGPEAWRRSLERAGFADARVDLGGFFPPPVLNRMPRALVLERSLERRRWLRPVLPFVSITGTR
jgi:SAM-dependent methyltransferase